MPTDDSVDDIARSNIDESRRMLAVAAGAVQNQETVHQQLQTLKTKGQRCWGRDDIIWSETALGLATQGGSDGVQLVITDDSHIDKHRYGSVAFGTLDQITPDHHRPHLEARLYGSARIQSNGQIYVWRRDDE